MDETHTSREDNVNQSVQHSNDLLNSLKSRAEALVQEIKSYQQYLQKSERHRKVEIRTFVRGLEAEAKTLSSIFQNNISCNGVDCNHQFDSIEDGESTHQHSIRSSNLVHYEAVWSVTRRCRGVLALNKKMYWMPRSQVTNDSHLTPESVARRRGKSVLVDIVAEDGLEWIKVSTISEKRLIFEIAKEGWSGYDDESDESDIDCGESGINHTAGKLEIVRLAEHLVEASQTIRINFYHPRIRIVLPRITEGSHKDVDLIIADLRATGAIVECGDDVPLICSNPEADAVMKRPLSLEQLLPSTSMFSPILTPTLNIDCTILLALISDISHISFLPTSSDTAPPNPDFDPGIDSNSSLRPYHEAIRRQIAGEQVEPLLPHNLYPILIDRDLECTEPAAQRMREIVATMGTQGEARRAQILFAQGEYQTMNREELRDSLSHTSTHLIPEELRLPIKVVTFEPISILNDNDQNATKSFPTKTARSTIDSLNLTRINTSVFLYGWVQDIVTVTSNRVVAMGLVKTINSVLDREEADAHTGPTQAQKAIITGGNGNDARNIIVFRGPKIHVCETARSLIGKDKPKKST